MVGLLLGAQMVSFPTTLILTMRRVLKVGLGPVDVDQAIEQASRERLEEVQLLRPGFLHGVSPGRRRVWTVAGMVLLVAGAGMLASGQPYGLLPIVVGSVVLVGSFVMRLRIGADWGRRQAMGLGLRFLKSYLGRGLFRLAGLGVKVGQQNAPPASQRTELVLGDAAGALFQALPSQVRKRLIEVPDVIKRLEGDAGVLRQRELALGNAIAKARPDRDVKATTGRREATVVQLIQARDATRQRLATAVAALEVIRLDLLRLQAGVGSPEDLTADLERAREIAAAVSAEIAGRQEVSALLHSEPYPTPQG